MCLLATAARADSVSTSAQNGFARYYFTLEPAAHTQAELAGGVLSISFDRKVDLAISALSQNLGGYVTSVRQDADGKTFRVALSQNVRLHTSTSANHFAVDLVPESFAGVPPDLPAPPPAERSAVDIAKLPALAIRAGAYSNFTRLVFDWPRKVAYSVFPGNGHLTVRFEAEARPDLSALANVAPPWIKETGWRIEGRGTVLEFETDAASGYHDFRDETKVVLDVLAPKADASTYKPPAGQGTDTAKLKVTKLTGGNAVGSAQAKAVIETAAALKGQIAPAQPAVPKSDESEKNKTAVVTPPQAAAPAAPAAGVAQAQRTGAGFAMNFAGAGHRAVAAFIRGATAWIVLDGSIPIDVAGLKSSLGDMPVDASTGETSSIVRVGLSHPAQIAVRTVGADLKVVVAANVATSNAPIGFVRSDDSSRASLTTLLPGATHAVRVADPAVGDSLIVVPAFPGRAATQARRYGEFGLLPTSTGLAIVPFSDDLEVSAAASRVTIGRPKGLALAAPSQPAVSTPAALSRSGEGSDILDFAAWSRAPGGTVFEQQRRLRRALADARPDEVQAARLRLAHFYLANQFSAEALGILNIIQGADPSRQGERELQIMRAASEYMLGRYRDARNEIAANAFDNDRNAAFWRGLIEVGQRDWPAARRDFSLAAPLVAHYPAEWQARARIAEALAALSTEAIEVADADLAHLPEQMPKALAEEAQLARAELLSAEGHYGQAKEIFEVLAQSDNGRTGAEAILANVEGGLAAGTISQASAIDVLDRLRFRWRGDALELETLRKLGALYVARQRWHDGLAILRVASLSFPNEELARAAQDDMRAIFDSLFLKGKADRLSPIQALGLFYDFIDLTPIGPNGDEMIRRMADRLVAVDLLEPAAALMQYQVTKRLDGVARAQVATRLAMIDLLDHKPKDALEALRESQVTGLPAETVHQRTILQARALAALKQWDAALDMIATDDAADTRQLRADIYWESGNWQVAGQKAEQLASTAASGATPISPESRALVMRSAIAYALANDETSLARLRNLFSARMSTTPDASAFAVVTQQRDTQMSAFRDAAGQIASIDTLQVFMKDFRRRYDSARVTN